MKKNVGNTPVIRNRKVLRKQKRLQKKIKRQEHYTKNKNPEENIKFVPGSFVKRPVESPVLHNEDKKKKKNLPTPQDLLNKERQKDMKEAEKLKSQMDERRKQMFLKANEEEDKVIKKLEKQLGLNKCKNKKNYFTDDGLDYLLEICDRSTSEQIVAAEKHIANVDGESDFEEDLAAVTGKEIKSKKITTQKGGTKTKLSEISNNDGSDIGSEDSEADDDFDEEFDDNRDEAISDNSSNEDIYKNSSDTNESYMSDSEEDKLADNSYDENFIPPKKAKLADGKSAQKKDIKNIKSTQSGVKPNSKKQNVIKEDELSKVFSDDEISHLSGDENDDMCELTNDSEDGENVKKTEKPDVWEDIYGRKRDKEGNIIKEIKGVYVPPHLRNKDSASDKDMTQLKRQIKSVLNKLAGTNLHWACTTLENLYSSNSRNAVNTSLCQLWTEATLGLCHTPVRLVAEHAALVAVLHANVATEIGAHFLQELTKKFDAMMQTPQSMEDKRLDNLVSCLAHLYCFKIYHASLLYDMFARLMEDLTEKNVECVLLALRSVGGVLRKDDPLALKNFIHDTQARVAKLNEAVADGGRARQVVGGGLGVGRRGVAARCRTTKTWPAANEKLLRLAREQRMNTDVRRNIFCVIMGAELAIQYSCWDKIKELDSMPKYSVTNLAQFLVHLILGKGLP
ncbi:hypothetical protein ACJJTC_012518, partial [Scirpophaga incertulas]